MRKSPILLALLFAAAPAASRELTLERLFQSPALAGPTPREPKLSPDGALATLLRNRPDDKDRYDLWAIDTATGKARMLVDSAKVGSGAEVSEAEKMRRERARIAGTKGITDYEWAPDGKSIIVPIDGDLYLAALDGSVRRLTATKETEIDAKVSETGRFASFTRDQNLYDIDLASRHEQRLTDDGGGTLSWGAAEFVAQEELDRDTGYWWSPDDRRVAVTRVDESKVRIVTRAAIGAEGTRIFEQRYPVAGSANAIVDLYIMNPDGSGRVKADLGADPDVYLARVAWTKDGKSMLVERLSRDQKRLDLLRIDAVTGKSTLLFSETAKTWVNLNDNLKPLGDGSLIWSSERSGFSHLYRWNAGRWTQLTKGAWDVAKVAGVDETRGRVYFLGNKNGPLEQHLYAVDYRRPSDPVRLTEPGWTNNAVMDKHATRALVTRSNPMHPPQVYLADASGRRIAWMSENRLDADHPFAPYLDQRVEPVFGTIKAADGQLLNYSLLSPKRVPGRRYPVFFHVYGGPHGPLVSRSWVRDTPLFDYMVSEGWIVFSIDNRGTSFRGTAFDAPIYHGLGTAEVRDQLAGLAWLKRQDFVDPARVAVMGWSYGGYMTLKLLEAAPGAFAAGVAVAPVTRWELYDTAYTERYLGNPSVDPKPYERADALGDSAKIADPLLIMHGMADDNVVFENTTSFVAKLQREKRPFELMVYPGATHAIAGEGMQTHVWETIENFLDRTAKDPPPPSQP